MKKKKSDSYSYFKGARLKERDANKTGVGIICGVIGIIIALIITENHRLRLLIIAIAAGIGFFVLGPLLYKDNDKATRDVHKHH